MSSNKSVGLDEPASELPLRRFSVAALRSAIRGRVWGGHGGGAPCDFCNVLLTSSDVELEVEAQIGTEKVVLHFHSRCYDASTSGREPAGMTGPQLAPTERP